MPCAHGRTFCGETRVDPSAQPHLETHISFSHPHPASLPREVSLPAQHLESDPADPGSVYFQPQLLLGAHGLPAAGPSAKVEQTLPE